jgi:hypothetical protein
VAKLTQINPFQDVTAKSHHSLEEGDDDFITN